MELCGFHLTGMELVVLGVLLLAFAHQVFFYLRYLAVIPVVHKRRMRADGEQCAAQPPVSVIIAAKNEAGNLERHLPRVLGQDYPEFEVIVVDDASDDDTDMVLQRLKEHYPHLHTTFVPAGTKNIDSKKLALTLGVKAARHDLLLFTDADCHPQSPQWLACMVRRFRPGTEFVLGYGAYLPEDTFLNRLITYDTLFIAMQYMGLAYRGKAYRGTGRNMAYRRDTFFRLKGFSAHLDISSADDDLLVNSGATATNTAIEVSPESIMWSEARRDRKEWYMQKVRHLAATAKYRRDTKLLVGSERLSRGVCYAAFLLSCVSGHWITVMSATALLVLRYAMQCVLVNRAAALYGRRRYYATLPLFDILLPVVTLFIRLTGRSRRREVKWK